MTNREEGYPRSINHGGKTRWIAPGGKSYDTFEEAQSASLERAKISQVESVTEPKPNSGDYGWLVVVGVIGVLIWLGSRGSNREDEKAPVVTAPPPPATSLENQPAALPQPPPTPPRIPNYNFNEDGYYGYFGAVSDEDRAKGQATGAVHRFAYRGRSELGHRLDAINDAGVIVDRYACEQPCVVIRRLRGSATVERVQYNSRSIIGGAFEDAIAGSLRVRPERQRNPSAAVPQSRPAEPDAEFKPSNRETPAAPTSEKPIDAPLD